jgi:hypothetical protein
MKVDKKNLTDAQRKQIQRVLLSDDFLLLRQCVAAELTTHEVDLIDSDIWIDEQDIAKIKTKNLRISAKKYLNALEVLDEMSKDDYPFYTVTITTN